MPPDSRERPLRVYAALCGLIVGVIAASALLGWQFNVPRLRSLLPDQVAMNPATAICFLLSGLALWCVRSGVAGRRGRLFASGCAGIVALLAVVKLWGIATGHDLGFDQVLFSERLAGTATTPPNRMAPNTALSFLFVGGSLLMLARPGNAWRRASHLLAIPALLLAVFALLGYAYGVQAFYGVTTYIPMALNTALAFFLLSSAILVSRPGAGIAPLLVADDGGGHLLRRLLPATFAILAISGWLELQGVSARIFDPRFGLTLVVALNLLVLTTLGLASARWISRSDSALREAHDSLEERVAQRTAALTRTNARLADEIAERRRAEEALAASERHYRLLFDSNPQPMWVYDMDSLAFLAVNQAAIRQYGYTEEEFLGMTLRDIRPPEDVPALLEEVRRPPSVIQPAQEWRHRKKDGGTIDVQISADRLSFAGRPAKLVLATDITERKQIEAQFRQAQKLDAVGRLAGGVAHDFNNLLTVIMGQAQLLQMHLTRESPEAHRIDDILEAGHRATGLTRQLLAFSRKQVLAPVVIDLNAIIADSVKMLKRLIGEDVDLMVAPARNLGRIKADPGQIDQILMNLALNARDAMPEGGKITVETDDVDLDETYVSQHPMMEAGPYVMLSISDTGCGMDAATQARIFEPFFTTKEVGKGTGLGLATVYGIVKQSGGFIWVYSEVGRGTTFKVYFPRIEAGSEAEPHRAEAQPQQALNGNETVLVVEDEVRVRTLVRDTLARRGYTVLEAGNGDEAFLRAQQYPGPIHLILTDVIMPGQSGRELVDRLRPGRPDARVLFMSGYTDDAVVRHGIMNEGTAFLQKPFTTEILLRKTRDALDGVRRAA